MTLLRRTLYLVLLLTCLAWAQTASPTPESNEPTVGELRARLERVSERIKQAPRPQVGTTLTGDDQIPTTLDSLRRLDVSLRRLITLKETVTRLEEKIDAAKMEVDQVASTGLETRPPYSVVFLDELQTEYDLVQERLSGARLALTAAQTARELEQDRLDDLQARRRRLLDSQSSGELETRRKVEHLEVAIEAAQAGVKLADTEIKVAELELELTNRRKELLETKLAIAEKNFQFSRQTLEEQVANLEDLRAKFTAQLDRFRLAESTSQERLEGLLNDEIDDSEQDSELAMRREWVLTHQRKERLLEERLEFNLARQDLWERRFLVHAGEASTSYDEWEDSARGLLVRIEKNRDVLNTELSQIRTELASLLEEEARQQDDEADQENTWLEAHIQALVARQRALEDTLQFESETESLARRLLAELSNKQETAPLSERIGQAWSSLINFWNIELYTLGDSAVTVGKLCVAITILIVGLGFVGRITRFLSNKFLARLPIKDNARSNLERFLRYAFILLVFLFSLHVVNIPLTIFTFLGGTLAIAIGFGAQNILNNFISGLILLVERPVRTGDLIQVDDTVGTVEDIGARSTRIRVPSGIHVILPNSTLLENKVINLTLQDTKFRVEVGVGVAYGSPTRKVLELLEKSLDHDEVLRYPAPVFTFDDFGDSSLNFRAHFWVSANTLLDRDRITTKVRLSIDDLFREHGITIPFPQRDVNFNAVVPVRIISDDEEKK